PTLSGGLPLSTTGAERLNFRVRYGYGCFPLAIVTRSLFIFTLKFHSTLYFWSSPRLISTHQLSTLLYLHLGPINQVVYLESYPLYVAGNLILRGASCLDAFSTYPVQTWLLSCAVGTTTDAPAVCPSRSSRTRDSSSQISCARDG